MDFKRLLISLTVAIFLISLVKSDYELNEEEDTMIKESEKKDDFWKNFACMVGTQRYMSAFAERFNSMRENPSYPSIYDKCYSNVFRKCFMTITDEEKESVTKAKTREDFDAIPFKGLKGFKIMQFFNRGKQSLDDEEQEYLKIYNKTDKKVKEMQKNTMRENPDSEDNNDQLNDDVKKKISGKPKVGSFDLDSPLMKFFGLIMLFAFFGLLFYLSFSLTDEKTPFPGKKNKGKKQKTD